MKKYGNALRELVCVVAVLELAVLNSLVIGALIITASSNLFSFFLAYGTLPHAYVRTRGTATTHTPDPVA